MRDKIRVQCSRCRSTFQEKVSKLRDGYQSQCSNCGRLVTFSSDSGDLFVQKAMTEARRIRNNPVAKVVYSDR